MSLFEGQEVELAIEKPAAGGRMIARHLGQIVLVRGAIPGERVCAWIERAERRMAYAVAREIVDASPDRRAAGPDPLCGGALYAHIHYERQLTIKSDVLRDAFARVGRYPIEGAIDVAASPEEGYRMRARFHVHAGRAGFYREGTHQLCDAGPTRQLGDAAIASVTALAASLERAAPGAVGSIAISENLAASERAAHLELAPGARVDASLLASHAADAGLRGISAREPATPGEPLIGGTPVVTDPIAAVIGPRGGAAVVQRHAESFFQGNRHLLGGLVTAVIEAIPEAGEVLELYAGVGLFSVALAAHGREEITAIEGDRSSGADLRENARPHVRLDARIQRVEDYLASRRGRRPATILIDPPRTGLSKEAADGILRHAAACLVYVSCDPATLARDARKLLDAGYRLDALRAFDLFPNTPHIEALAVFTRSGANP